MGVIKWVGAQQATPQLDTITIGSATAGHTFVVTINGKTVTYVAVTGDTTSTVATGLAAALAAEDDGEFAELGYEASSATVLVTGPDDGAPFTATVGGTGTISTTTTTSPKSPHDAAAGANYGGGSLPSGGDTLVFEDSAVGVKYGLTALAGVALANVVRRRSFSGQWGLPTTNPTGYREYRATELQFDTALMTFEQAGGDQAGQFRVQFLNTAVTVTVPGLGGASLGSEPLEIRGMPSSSVLNMIGGGVAICPLAGQTGTITTGRCIASAVRVGSGATLTTLNLTDTSITTKSSVGTLNMDGASAAEFADAATVSSAMTIDGGSVLWRSTGNLPSTVVLGSGAAIDFSQAPAAVTIGGTVSMYEGSGLFDPFGRAGNWAVTTIRCGVQNVNIQTPNGKTITLS